MPVLARPRGGLLISLVRPSLNALAADRSRCVHCHRTPLIGEAVFYYGERLVCALCRPLRTEEPARTEVMRYPEHEHTVMPRAPGAYHRRRRWTR